MFTLTRPTAAAVAKQIAAAAETAMDGPRLLALRHGLNSGQPISGFAHDHSRSFLGKGEALFTEAKLAFSRWDMFDLGWVRVANPGAEIAVGQAVAVEVRSVGLWSVNVSKIVAVLDTGNHFGFIYATTSMHVEQGEERFLLEFERATGDVSYDLEAVSRPRSLLARMGFPVTRHFQHRFARDSHRRMREVATAQPQFLSGDKVS